MNGPLWRWFLIGVLVALGWALGTLIWGLVVG